MYISPKPCLARIRDDLANLARAVDTVASAEVAADFEDDVRALETAIGKLLAGIALLKCSRPLNLSSSGIQAAKAAGLSKVHKHLAVAEPGDRGYGQPGYAPITDADRNRLGLSGPAKGAQPGHSPVCSVAVFGATFATGEGRWGAIVTIPGQEVPVMVHGQEMSSDRDRMSLKAAIAALRQIPPNSQVVVRTDSASLVYGAERVLPALANTRVLENRQVKNPDLWRDLVAVTAGLDICWERVAAIPKELKALTLRAVARSQALL